MPTTPVDGGPLPANTSFQNLKKQAKSLLRGIRAGEPDALRRLKSSHPKSIDPRSAKLSDAQLIIAREYGCASWPKLKAYLETATPGVAADGKGSDRSVVPMVPLRDLVIFPGATVPLFVGRQKSLNALEAALPSKSLLVCTQHDQQTDEVTERDIFKTGTLVTPLELLQLYDGTVKVLVKGERTVRVETLDMAGDYVRATIAPMPDASATIPQDAIASARALFVGLVAALGLPQALADSFRETDDPGQLVDLAGQNFYLGTDEQQQLLEIAEPVDRFEAAWTQLSQLAEEIEALDPGEFVGHYHLASDVLIDVGLDDGSLSVSTPWDQHGIGPRGQDKFVPRGDTAVPRARRLTDPSPGLVAMRDRIRYRFVRDESGAIVGLIRSDWTGPWPMAQRSQPLEQLDQQSAEWRKAIRQHVGRYEVTPGKQRLISCQNGHLLCDGKELRPISPHDFMAIGEPMRISFKLNDEGRTIGMRSRAPHEALHFYKMDWVQVV